MVNVLIFLRQLFNREFVEAVLQEWYKTMSDLPTGLRQACLFGRNFLIFYLVIMVLDGCMEYLVSYSL